LVMRRAPVGGHTDADTRSHTPHERPLRWRVLPPSRVAHAEETGPAPGSTVPHGRGGPQASSHTPAAPWWCQTGRYSTAVPQRGVRWLHTGEAGYSDRWSGVAIGPREATEHLFEELPLRDRKSTRLNSSHLVISYAVFCLKLKLQRM